MPRFLIRETLIAFLFSTGVQARTLEVGDGKEFNGPSAAAAAAKDGDRVEIQPGAYYDCAIWRASELVIEGVGDPNTVVITDTTCQGKALFIVAGNDVTIRGLTLARARVPDRNGAGIRLEGQGLTLERVRFSNDEVGLLEGATGTGAVRISGSRFEAGGRGGEYPLFAVSVGEIGLLRIENSTFDGVRGGQISTAADRTELTGNRIDTGTGEAPAWAVMATGGDLVMEDNSLAIGPGAPRLATAVLAVGRGTPTLLRNRLENGTGQKAVLLRNWTGTDPVLEGNQVGPGDKIASTGGVWRHRAAGAWHATKNSLHGFAGRVKRGILALVGS
jgi:hypothetical protein